MTADEAAAAYDKIQMEQIKTHKRNPRHTTGIPLEIGIDIWKGKL